MICVYGAILSTGCGDKCSKGRVDAKQNDTSATSTIKIGATKKELKMSLGEPVMSVMLDHDLEMLEFCVPDQTDTSNRISVVLTNGRVESYSVVETIISAASGIGTPAHQSEQESFLCSSISFSIVSDTNFTGSKYVDKEWLPKLGYVRSKADFTTTHPVSVSIRGGGKASKATLNLDTADATQLRNLTATSLGKRLLVSYRDVYLCAPTVTGPLGGGSVEILLPEQLAAEFLAGHLRGGPGGASPTLTNK